MDDSLSTSSESDISEAPVEKTGEFVGERPEYQSDEKDKSALSGLARVVDVESTNPSPEAQGPDVTERMVFEDMQTEEDSEAKRAVLQRVFVRAAWLSAALCLIITFVSPPSTCFFASI